jgi:hypothetical protein
MLTEANGIDRPWANASQLLKDAAPVCCLGVASAPSEGGANARLRKPGRVQRQRDGCGGEQIEPVRRVWTASPSTVAKRPPSAVLRRRPDCPPFPHHPACR